MTLPRIALYRNPETSEASDEWDSLIDALCEDPRTVRDELMANGEQLAVAFDPTSAGVTRLSRERFPEDWRDK